MLRKPFQVHVLLKGTGLALDDPRFCGPGSALRSNVDAALDGKVSRDSLAFRILCQVE